jgi:hypothetical protein
MRRERSIGLREAVNELIRAGLLQSRRQRSFEQQTHDLGEGIDYSNVADAIETLDGTGRPLMDPLRERPARRRRGSSR